MRRISLREANQQFSACIAEVEQGEHIVVERRGVPVAEIIPFQEKVPSKRRREESIREMMAILERGIPMGAQAPTRDEMHDR